MEIKIRIPAISNLKLEQIPFDFEYKDIKFQLHCNKQNLVNFVEITKKVDACDKSFIGGFKKVKESLDKGEWITHPLEKQIIDVVKLFENVLYDKCELRLDWLKGDKEKAQEQLNRLRSLGYNAREEANKLESIMQENNN